MARREETTLELLQKEAIAIEHEQLAIVSQHRGHGQDILLDSTENDIRARIAALHDTLSAQTVRDIMADLESKPTWKSTQPTQSAKAATLWYETKCLGHMNVAQDFDVVGDRDRVKISASGSASFDLEQHVINKLSEVDGKIAAARMQHGSGERLRFLLMERYQWFRVQNSKYGMSPDEIGVKATTAMLNYTLVPRATDITEA